jgi:uncharacterized repeat protein (TIGR01451 family)
MLRNRAQAAGQAALLVHLARALFVLLSLCLFPSAASAQTVNQYTNTTTGSIVDSIDCATTVTRTFTVGTSYTVSDVNLGVFLTHSYRSDLRITLTSPGGTTVAIMTNTAGNGDNLNDLFDDEAPSGIASHSASGTDSTTTPPPYSHSFRPTSVLNAFDGQNAQGTWTMVVCDSVAQDTGTFTRADLYITEAPTSYADLSLTKTVSNATPANGASITYTLTVTNASASTLTATGVTVQDALPLGVSYTSASGTGTYNSGTGVWTVGSLTPGASASITITVTVTATSGATVTNGGEVSASSVADLDSTPNNGSTAEDDDAFVSFTVSGTRTAGTLPTLSCPSGNTLLDWNSHSWTSGSSTGSATLTNIGTVNFAVSSQGTYNAPLALTSDNTGGFGAGQLSLFQSIEYTDIFQTTTTTVTLPTAVPGAQFRVLDVDFAANDFADKLTVTGSFNGSPVTPVLTNGVANYVIGNVAIGDASSGATSANGNVGVTFSSPVDTITIVYGNHITAPADPDGQAISIYDFTFCSPVATLSVSKISSVLSDGVSASNPKAIPGATVQYCITLQNNGSGTTTSVAATDALPANMTYVAGSMASGATCGTASTAEDDNNSGGDETDPFGMSITGTTITGTATSLAPNATFAMVFNMTVN